MTRSSRRIRARRSRSRPRRQLSPATTVCLVCHQGSGHPPATGVANSNVAVKERKRRSAKKAIVWLTQPVGRLHATGGANLAMGGKVIKCPSPLNVLKYTYDHSCY